MDKLKLIHLTAMLKRSHGSTSVDPSYISDI